MALTASMPVIEDLAMKFNRHSLHDTFQLPSFYSNQYPVNWQAKEFALYFQPSHGFLVEPKLDGVAPFEFKASGNFTTKRGNRYKTQTDRASTTRHSPKRNSNTTEQLRANKTQTLLTNPASDKKDVTLAKSNAVKTLDFDEDSSSEDDEELSCYFSKETECSERFVTKASVESSPTRSHNRKRSMEDEECTAIKRCCRPRLNFDKMLLNSRDALERTMEEDTTNYFRPISPQELLS